MGQGKIGKPKWGKRITKGSFRGMGGFLTFNPSEFYPFYFFEGEKAAGARNAVQEKEGLSQE